MLPNEANLLWLSSVCLLVLTTVRMKVCIYVKKKHQRIKKIYIACTVFFSANILAFPFFLQRTSDGQGWRLCLGTGQLPLTFASDTWGQWYLCSENWFSTRVCRDKVSLLMWQHGCSEAWDGKAGGLWLAQAWWNTDPAPGQKLKWVNRELPVSKKTRDSWGHQICAAQAGLL